jgi:hypothetical protein
MQYGIRSYASNQCRTSLALISIRSIIGQLIQSPNGKHRRPSESKIGNKSKLLRKDPDYSDKFLVCEDCKHNTITYDPSKDGTCDCGCH